MRKYYRKTSLVRSLNEVQQELKRPSNSLLVILIIALIAMAMVGFVWQKVKVAQLVQDIDRLEKQVTYYKEMNEKLQGKILFLMNEDRIVNIARDQLQMIFPPYEIVPLNGKINQD